MIGFIAYQTFIALNLHFKKDNDYDYITFYGKTKVNEESLKKNKHKWQFAGLEKRLGNELMKFYYQVFKYYNFSWVGDKQLFKAVKSKTIQQEVSKMDSFIQDGFKRDCRWLANQLDSIGLERFALLQTGELYPLVYEWYKEKSIELETLLLINCYVHNVLNRNCSKDILFWPSEVEYLSRISKLMPLFYDKKDVELMFETNFVRLGYSVTKSNRKGNELNGRSSTTQEKERQHSQDPPEEA